ncbi:MAG: peptide-methionine (S)-S-oxide reductase MsrA [Acidimicrobiia bacterium]|nr:peptide-methionine (S)-S-oxide reductase MsrA [Acidimicrobiia bacterium]MYH55832.1 peptide-methionine (S)-S-oxide reductase MsrA [Acidimicrobiia bacterium]
MFGTKSMPVTPEQALTGRETPILSPLPHFVHGRPIAPPFPSDMETAYFGMGCFWGVERIYWQIPGVYTTAAGYQGGYTPNPTYREVCSGATGHTEAVLVVFDPNQVSYADLLKRFWEEHNPTQGMRQGNDRGTQYRSAIYWTSDAQSKLAEQTRETYENDLQARGFGPITTEIREAPPFYYAEDYHQQYLAKIPNGYCGLKGTGVSCQVPAAR